MKEIIVKRINVLSVMKPLILISGGIGLVLGVIVSLLAIPFSSIVTTTSSSSDVINSITTPVAGVFGAMVGVVFSMIISCVGIALVVGLGLLLFNLICRVSGGIKIEIEERHI